MTIIHNTYLTPREASDMCGVHSSSIKRWIRSGLIKAFRTAGGHRRIPAREIYAFLRSQGMPLPEKLVRFAKEAFGDDNNQYSISNNQNNWVEIPNPKENTTARGGETGCKVLVLGDGEDLARWVEDEGLSESVLIERAQGFAEAGAKMARFMPHVVLVKSDGPGRTAEDLKAELKRAGLAAGVGIYEFKDGSSAIRILRGIVVSDGLGSRVEGREL